MSQSTFTYHSVHKAGQSILHFIILHYLWITLNNIKPLNIITALNSVEYTGTLDKKSNSFCHCNDPIIKNDLIVAQQSDQNCINQSKREYFAILLL